MQAIPFAVHTASQFSSFSFSGLSAVTITIIFDDCVILLYLNLLVLLLLLLLLLFTTTTTTATTTTTTTVPALFKKTLVKKISALDFLNICIFTAPSS